LNVAVCAQCHQDGHYHTRVEQWERSPHFKGFKEVSEEEGDNATCARCHSPNGYVDVSKRIAAGQDVVSASRTNNYATGAGELICQGCHDPHHTFDDPERHQLRIYDTVVIGNPAAAGSVVLSNQGASATCMYCHNSRRLATQLSGGQPQYRAQRSGQLSGPHESPVAEVFNGLGAVTYGVAMGNTFHTYGANCVACHMYPNPAIGAPGHNQVGDHTFNMSYMDGDTKVENLAACNQCHAGSFAVDKFDFKSLAAKDWDGNGVVAGIQTETQGLLDRVRTLLTTTGLQSITNAEGAVTAFATNGLSTVFEVREAQLKAAWNWMLINRDHSKGVHNPLFTLRLLQNTYTDLSTNYYGDVNMTFTNAFPSAVLR
jgi:formate-dependent nitrite reductase cytochrome c552 subunit